MISVFQLDGCVRTKNALIHDAPLIVRFIRVKFNTPQQNTNFEL